ncbi:MAG: UDP-2,3-diacylglucosamine diphosphatase [Candidatus Eutrophobiaceae bacterium]
MSETLPADPILFISDLHLCDERPESLALFSRLLCALEGHLAQLWILGDLFERFWVGMDDKTPCNTEIITRLRAYVDAGGMLSILRGNRDFLLDQHFAAACGARLLDEPVELRWGQKSLALLHGDILCVQDKGYQRWRRFVTHPLSGKIFMSLPLAWRRAIAHSGRKAILRIKQGKPEEITDADEDCVWRLLREQGVDLLIHGHTHRASVHDYDVHGRKCQRVVLGDWYGEAPQALVLQSGKFHLMPIESCLEQILSNAPPSQRGAMV